MECRFPYHRFRYMRACGKQDNACQRYTPAMLYPRIPEKPSAQEKQKKCVCRLHGYHQRMPGIGIGMKELVKDPGGKLCKLVKAGNARLRIVDIVTEWQVPDIMQPPRRIIYPSRLCR